MSLALPGKEASIKFMAAPAANADVAARAAII